MVELRKAAEMALAALEWSCGGEPLGTKEFEAITALRQALAQPEQEPVAWLHPDRKIDVIVPSKLPWFDKPIPLYTAPPKQVWQGLTDEEIFALWTSDHDRISFARAIEAKLREKNGHS